MANLNRRALTVAERDLKEQCEETIRAGLTSFIEVGQALMAVRDNRLYREQHATFEDYCTAEWQISRTRGYELINAAAVVSAIADTGLPQPANEAQARELSRIPEEQRAEVWQKTLDQTEGKPTADAIKAAAGRNKTSGPAATSPAGETGEGPELGADDSATAGLAAGDRAADRPAPAAPEDHRDAAHLGEAEVGVPSAPSIPAGVSGVGGETGPEGSSPEATSGPVDTPEQKVTRNNALTEWAQDTPEYRKAARRKQFFAFLQAGEKFLEAVGPDEIAADLEDVEFGDAEQFSEAFVRWLTAVEAIRKQNTRLRLVKGA